MKRNVRTTVLIGPSHTRYWELLHQAGLLPQYEQWKEKLVAINQKVATDLNKEPLVLWDFSLPNEITNERFPAAGDSATRMKYYYEAVHFNQHTGALMLDKMGGQPDKDLPENFGVQIHTASLPHIHSQLRMGLQQYRAGSPESVKELLTALPENRSRATVTKRIASQED